MTHIANQRIKMGGTYYTAGDPITLTQDDLKALPHDAVIVNDDFEETTDESNQTQDASLSDNQKVALKAAVAKLKPGAFKQDGEIRSGALKGLNDQMDFVVTVEAVAAIKSEGEA